MFIENNNETLSVDYFNASTAEINTLIHQVFFFHKVKHYFLLSKILLFTK